MLWRLKCALNETSLHILCFSSIFLYFTVQDEIRSVTGQTNLIITERFAQFSHLIDRSEGKCDDNKSDGKAIMASDLQGFWDMILFQVYNSCKIFSALKSLLLSDDNS